MTFNSYIFIFVFLPAFLLGIYLLRRVFSDKSYSLTLIRMWIIIASVIFFVGYGKISLGALFLSVSFNAVMGYLIYKKNISVIPGIIVNIAFLCFFKYNGSIIMPVAVSFYTFSQIAFLIELKRGEIPRYDLLEYLSFILFFPKIMQGPIADYKNVSGQIEKLKDKMISSDDVLHGIILFTFGLAKKVLLSDVLGKGADYGYQSLSTLTALDAVIVSLCFTFQLYFDFSGYCDMAEGICRMMGIDLDINFNEPYKAGNIGEFWDRWHITLTRFFTRYVYIPLGGSRRGTFRTYINILIVFLLSGIWHGAGLSFIVWGMLHGLAMVFDRAVGKKRCAPLTFIYVNLAWVFFRASTIGDALTLIGKIFSPNAWYYGHHVSIKLAECFQLDELWYILKVTPIAGMPFGGYICMWLILALSALLVFKAQTARALAGRIKRTPFVMVVTGLLFVWCTISLGNVSTFLYVNF